MRVAVLRVLLMIGDAHSLKEKRRVLRALKDRIQSRYSVAVAETGSQDLWQKAELSAAFVALDSRACDAGLQTLESFIRRHPGAIVTRCERAILDPRHEFSESWVQKENPDPDYNPFEDPAADDTLER